MSHIINSSPEYSFNNKRIAKKLGRKISLSVNIIKYYCKMSNTISNKNTVQVSFIPKKQKILHWFRTLFAPVLFLVLLTNFSATQPFSDAACQFHILNFWEKLSVQELTSFYLFHEFLVLLDKFPFCSLILLKSLHCEDRRNNSVSNSIPSFSKKSFCCRNLLLS